MAKQKFDGVIEAVHYDAEHKIAWVRMYERHGFVFSDVNVVPRDELVAKIKAGKRIVPGKRVLYQGNMFEVTGEAVRLLKGKDGIDVITNASANGHDQLQGVPII